MNPTSAKESSSGALRSRMMLVAGLLIVIGLVAGRGGWGGYRSSAEREIRALLDRRAQALHEKDLPQYLSCFSPDYQSGSQTYTQLKHDATQWFSQFATIQLVFDIAELHIQENTAFVEDSYTFSVTSPEGGEPITISKREVLEIRRESKEWKIYKTRAVQ